MTKRTFTSVVRREDDGYTALCPELDVASQGSTMDEAQANLREAVELLLETASASEIERRLGGETCVTPLDVEIG